MNIPSNARDVVVPEWSGEERNRFKAQLDGYIQNVRECWHNVGVSVSIVRGDEVVYAIGFGQRQVGETAAVGSNTLFQIGSTTKAIAAAALGILVDEGKIHWSDRIIDYVPEFALEDPWLTRSVTIRDALCHRTGINDCTYLPAAMVMNVDEAVRELRRAKADFRFRDSYRYSNLMYAVLGKVTETASGMKWGAWVRSRILEPLGMIRSFTSPYDVWDASLVAPTFLGSPSGPTARFSDARVDEVAMPHAWEATGGPTALAWQSYDNAAAAGSIVSNASDLARWLILNLNEGRFQGNRVLKRETLEELHAAHNPHVDVAQFPFIDEGESYAMGWRRAQYRGTPHLAHGGGIIGFAAYVALLPVKKLGVVVLSNGCASAREDLGSWKMGPNKAIAFWVFDRLLGGPLRDWNAEFLTGARAARQKSDEYLVALSRARLRGTHPALPFGEYAGHYGSSNGSEGRQLAVATESDGLRLQFEGFGAFSAVLEHWHGELFRVQARVGVSDLLGPQFASFTIDPWGRVDSLHIFGETFRRLAMPHVAESNV